jgi:hypothetical protein
MDARSLKFTIMEKEFLLLKQKLELLQNSHGAYKTLTSSGLENFPQREKDKATINAFSTGASSASYQRRGDSSEKVEGAKKFAKHSPLTESFGSAKRKLI